jgi:hypothetical protein
MTEPKKLTPTQEVKQLKALILQLNAEHQTELAKVANENYTLGLEEGTKEMQAAFAAQSVLQRWMYKA